MQGSEGDKFKRPQIQLQTGLVRDRMSLADSTHSFQEFCYRLRTLVPLYTEIRMIAKRRHLVFQPINSVKQASESGLKPTLL